MCQIQVILDLLERRRTRNRQKYVVFVKRYHQTYQISQNADLSQPWGQQKLNQLDLHPM